MKRKDYEKALRKLQVRLCHLQEWIKQEGLRVVIVFEGRDGAGKGGVRGVLNCTLDCAGAALRERDLWRAQCC